MNVTLCHAHPSMTHVHCGKSHFHSGRASSVQPSMLHGSLHLKFYIMVARTSVLFIPPLIPTGMDWNSQECSLEFAFFSQDKPVLERLIYSIYMLEPFQYFQIFLI